MAERFEYPAPRYRGWDPRRWLWLYGPHFIARRMKALRVPISLNALSAVRDRTEQED